MPEVIEVCFVWDLEPKFLEYELGGRLQHVLGAAEQRPSIIGASAESSDLFVERWPPTRRQINHAKRREDALIAERPAGPAQGALQDGDLGGNAATVF